MFNSRKATAALVISAPIVWLSDAPVAIAQTTPVAASAPSKAAAKAQRKADRKVARAKKNAELKDLEKNGYQPGGDQINYPQNIQNAERKAATSNAKGGSGQ